MAKGCEGCKRKLPKNAHPNRRFCTHCRKKRHTATGRRKRHSRSKGPGRQTKCTPEAIREYCEAWGMGLTRAHAAECIGVSGEGVSKWFARARAALEAAGIDEKVPPEDALKLVPKRERPYVEILLRSQRVRAQGTRSLFGVIHRSAHGGAHWERNPNYNPRDPDSPKYVKTGYNPPDTRAAKYLLAIRDPDYSERRRNEISGPGGGPVQTGVVIEMPAELPLSAYIKPESEGGEGE